MTTSTTSQPQAGHPVRVRASDADRNATVDLVQDAIARGLLTHDEGGERMSAAYAATYRDELPVLTADLPPAGPAPLPASGWRPLWAMLVVQLRHEVHATRAAGIRSQRFAIMAVVALCLVALVVAGIAGAFHGGPGFDGPGPGFRGGR
jgi:Domain of unknown function (DUF1707)